MSVKTFKMKHRSDKPFRSLRSAVPNLEQERPVKREAIAAPSQEQGSPRAPLGAGGWITIVALFGFLLASIALAFWGWNLTDAKISSSGMVSLALGVVVTTAVGGGLMALVFWSSRNGYDR